MITHHSCIYIYLCCRKTPSQNNHWFQSGVTKTPHCWAGIVGRRLRPRASPWWLRRSKQFSFITGPGGWESNRLRLPPRFSRNFSNHRTCHHLDVHSIPGLVFSIELRNKTSVPSHHTDWLIYHGSVFTIGSNEVKPPPSEDSWSNYHVLNPILAGRRTSFAYVQSCTSFEISTNTFISSILGCKFKPRMCLSSIRHLLVYICMTDDYI